MENNGYTSLLDRERDTKSRIHSELTGSARERLIQVVLQLPTSEDLSRCHENIGKQVALSELHDTNTAFDTNDPLQKSISLLQSADTEATLTFIEYIIKQVYDHFPDTPRRSGFVADAEAQYAGYKVSDIVDTINEIEHVLETEGILYRVEHTMRSHIEFHKIESEAFEESDQKIQALAEIKPWGTALRSYNDAFERYRKGKFDEQIPKKLYHSIEEVLKTICVDLHGWTENREMKHSKYLELLDENDFYKAHGATRDEFGDFVHSLERMVAKVSAERKQKHVPYHDRVYATLLIHQVGAYLYFLISRHEDYS
jgi:hypothetical protein